MAQRGTLLGPYEILDRIGVGGMGEVFRARDTRLGRTVAIKRCQERFSDRFRREAAAIAALNHPHICTLYDIGPDYLVMEYVEGKSIIGPLSPDLAISYAEQILDALDAAHRCGIIHRDVKPSNILLTSVGVKLLDFGLAKIRHDDHDDKERGPGSTATLLTAEHAVLGTPGYMAPEQVEGREADHRADIFAFGCLFFEFLTGSPAFQGKSAQGILAATLTREPPRLTTLQPGLPASLQLVVDGCLQKDREKRWQSPYDVRLALGAAAVSTDAAFKKPRWPAIAAMLAAMVVLVAVAYSFRPRNPPLEPRILTLAPPGGGSAVFATVSPDGKSIGIVTGGKLWIQPLDSAAAVLVAGGDDARSPFWSPDSREIGFFAKGKLMRAFVRGGSSQVISTASHDASGAWSPLRSDPPFLVFSRTVGGLFRVPASGGAVSSVTSLGAGENRHILPAFLPDGRLLYAVQGATDKVGIRLARLDEKGKAYDSQLLIPGARFFAYVEPRGARNAVILFSRGILLAQGFDPSAGKLIGEPTPLTKSDTGFSGLDTVSASADGRVALFLRSANFNYAEAVEFNRDGLEMRVIAPLSRYLNLRLSPDGRKLAFAQILEDNLDLWVYDIGRGTGSRFTSHPAADGVPVWSPSSTHIVFATWRTGVSDIYVAGATGVAAEQPFIRTSASKYPCDWSRDGHLLLYETGDPATGWDLWTVPVSDNATAGQPTAFLTSEFNERDGRFSHDGKWVAYVSDETGREEVYLRTLAPGGTKLQVSNGGGSKPEWGREGSDELYFASSTGDLMSVSITLAPTPAAGTPRKLFAAGIANTFSGSQFALNLAGTRVFALRRSATSPDSRLVLAMDWNFAQN